MSPETTPPTAPLLSEEEVPLIGVGRVEFCRGLDRLEHAGERIAEREGRAILNSIGWVLVFIGFYVALGGWVLTSRKGKLR